MKHPIGRTEQRGSLHDEARPQPGPEGVERAEVYARLSRLVPLVALEGDRIAEAFAARHGLHRTDAQALSLLMDADEQRQTVTAGLLGKELRLTSGATTFCIARLEKAELAIRGRDELDQRKVIVSLSARGHQLGLDLLRPVSVLRNRVMDRFETDELAVVQRFLSATTDAMAEYRKTYGDIADNERRGDVPT